MKITNDKHTTIPAVSKLWVYRIRDESGQWYSAEIYYDTADEAKAACLAGVHAIQTPMNQVFTAYVNSFSNSMKTAHIYRLTGGRWFYSATAQSPFQSILEFLFNRKNPESLE